MMFKLDGIPVLAWNGHQREVVLNDAVSDDLNIISALKYIFTYQQLDISKIQIAGLTGAAFYIGWNTEHLSSGMGGSVFLFPHRKHDSLFQRENYCGYDTLFDFFGMEYDILWKSDP